MTIGILHLVCGKIAAGKSTLCGRLAAEPATVLISQDEWMATLYPEEIGSIEDMLKYSQRLRSAMGGHVAQLLRAGLSVVLDFPANRIEWRRWMLDIAEQAQSPHVLHFLDVPNEVCKARLKGRNAEGKHQYVVSDETFELILSRIELPSEAEGLNIQLEPWV